MSSRRVTRDRALHQRRQLDSACSLGIGWPAVAHADYVRGLARRLEDQHETDQDGAKAWLQGRFFVATLIETLIAVGERFSPWGYFLSAKQGPPLSLA